MDFTRQPIIETVITPREGCKLVVRSSKGIGQEEYFVDALEVVSFGGCFFFRSLERPKCFLVPVSDYEVIEAREARMVLKHVAPERLGQKISQQQGRDVSQRVVREPRVEQPQEVAAVEEEASLAEPKADLRLDKKRDRRRNQRRRRTREEPEEAAPLLTEGEGQAEEVAESREKKDKLSPAGSEEEALLMGSSLLSTLLPPPPTLISETIARYKDNDMFKGAFFSREEKILSEEEIHITQADEEGPDLDIFTPHPWDAEVEMPHGKAIAGSDDRQLDEEEDSLNSSREDRDDDIPADQNEGISSANNGNS